MMRMGTFTKLGVIATVFAWTVVVLASRMTATRRSVVILPPSWVVSVLFPLVGLPMGEAGELSGGGLLVMALGMLVHWPLIGWLLDRRRSSRSSQ